ncbi:hypothetical protein DMN91_010075, partial [Ooceraea biroi]
MLIHLY